MGSRGKSIRCIVDIDLSAVTCPGVWIPRRQEVYISICFLGQYRRTCLVSPTFPLIFRESLRFEKTFFDVIDPSQVCRLLEGQHILIELIQLSPCHEEGLLLGCYESNAKTFLFPSPESGVSGINRYLLFEKTNDFPANGVSPRLEYKTFTVMKDIDDSFNQQNFGRSRTPGYQKPTFSSAIRTMENAQLSETKPKFAFRKVDNQLIGRMPGRHPTKSILKGKKRKVPSSQPLSPYSWFPDYPIHKEFEANIPRLSPALRRSTSASRIPNYSVECIPPHLYYDSVDILARDLERASLRFSDQY